MRKKLKIGISACLLGLKYRYDGLSKTDRNIIDSLKDRVDFIPVCPEVECGLSVPRPKMRLENTPRGTRIRIIETGEDITPQMLQWAEIKLEQLESKEIAAFIFKSKSPSCGLRTTPVFDRDGHEITRNGSGIFAAQFKRKFPGLTVFQETDFPDAAKYLELPDHGG